MHSVCAPARSRCCAQLQGAPRARLPCHANLFPPLATPGFLLTSFGCISNKNGRLSMFSFPHEVVGFVVGCVTIRIYPRCGGAFSARMPIALLWRATLRPHIARCERPTIICAVRWHLLSMCKIHRLSGRRVWALARQLFCGATARCFATHFHWRGLCCALAYWRHCSHVWCNGGGGEQANQSILCGVVCRSFRACSHGPEIGP